MRSAAGVPPGSRVKCVGGPEFSRSGFRARTRVDLPEKSRPSIVTKMPRNLCGLAVSLGRGAPEGVALGGTDVRLEEVPVLGPGGAHRLGVPLDPDQPPLRQVDRFDSLYHAVGRAGDRDEAGSEILYGLVVVGIDLELVGAHDLCDLRATVHLDLVRRLPLGRLLAVPEQDRVIHLRGKVLV